MNEGVRDAGRREVRDQTIGKVLTPVNLPGFPDG
jgi:hypothetical protein